MKLSKVKQNLAHSVVSIVCVSSLVSCYTVAPSRTAAQPNPAVASKPSGLKTQAELDAAAKAKADKEAARKSWLKRNKERLEREERERLNAEKKEAAAYRKKTTTKKKPYTSKKTTITKPTTTKPKVVIPKTVKFAAPVPGKSGFVYNPYTHNQVDVRGIPSGTKVRDPHDSNPAHIFKVP